jgi:hypothetical protein
LEANLDLFLRYFQIYQQQELASQIASSLTRLANTDVAHSPHSPLYYTPRSHMSHPTEELSLESEAGPSSRPSSDPFNTFEVFDRATLQKLTKEEILKHTERLQAALLHMGYRREGSVPLPARSHLSHLPIPPVVSPLLSIHDVKPPHPSIFQGHCDLIKVSSWLAEVEQYLTFYNIDLED